MALIIFSVFVLSNLYIKDEKDLNVILKFCCSMTKYVVFCGENSKSIDKAIGYIDNWKDRGILSGNTRKGHIAKPEHIGLWFSEDKKIKKELGKMNLPERYYVIRVEVEDEISLKKEVTGFYRRYGLEHRIYEL